jgi:hypothetical protein
MERSCKHHQEVPEDWMSQIRLSVTDGTGEAWSVKKASESKERPDSFDEIELITKGKSLAVLTQRISNSLWLDECVVNNNIRIFSVTRYKI